MEGERTDRRIPDGTRIVDRAAEVEILGGDIPRCLPVAAST